MVDDQPERLVEPLVRVALRQQPEVTGERLQAVDRGGAVEQPRGIEIQRLDLKRAEMLVEPGAPEDVDPVAGLEHRLLLAGSAAAHEPEMATVGARHDFQDGACLAMPAGAENDSLVAPFHARSLSPLRRRNQGSPRRVLAGARYLTKVR